MITTPSIDIKWNNFDWVIIHKWIRDGAIYQNKTSVLTVLSAFLSFETKSIRIFVKKNPIIYGCVNWIGWAVITHFQVWFFETVNNLIISVYRFETSDGTFRREDGGLLNKEEGSNFVVRGEYGYFDPNGRHFIVQYVADDKIYGFR